MAPRLHTIRRVAAGAVLAGVVAAAALILPSLIGGDGSPYAGLPAGIALIDEESGEEIAFIPPSVVKEPAEAIFAEGRFWVLDLSPVSFVEIEAKTGKVVRRIASPFADVGHYAVDGSTLWVTDHEGSGLSKVEVTLGREVERFDLAAEPSERSVGSTGVVVAEGSVWVGRHDPVSAVLEVDPATGKVRQRIENIFGSAFLAFGDGAVWAAGGGGVRRIDAATGRATRVAEPTGQGGTETGAAGGGFGWTANETKGEVYKFGGRGELGATYRTGLGARSLSYVDGAVWVANQDVGTVTKLDAVSGKSTAYRFEHPVQAVAAGDGVILVGLLPGRSFEDRIEALEGDVVKIFLPAHALGDHADPAVVWDASMFQVEAATCLKLLNYPDAAAPDGWDLKPEAAVSMPTVSADGRTYTFTVKPGFKFSPPSNQPVTAETFRYSIERALSPKMRGAPGGDFLGDIEGFDAFRNGGAEQISGLRAQGDTLSITLVAPSPDFLPRLAMPFFCPVPTDSPTVPGGAARPLPEGRRTVPSAGPYYIADRYNGEYAILRPNPNYPGPRPRKLDAIALRESVDASVAVRRVQEEGWHGVVHFSDPLFDPGGALDARWGGASEAAGRGDRRFFTAPLPHLGYIAFNAGKAPFNDPEVRRAAALAMNRRALAALWRQAPTDQILPPAHPGFEDRALFSLDAPDLERARALMRGRTARATMAIVAGCEPCRREAEALSDQLAPIGIRLDLEGYDDPWEAAFEGEPIDLLDGDSGLDYLDPASFLERMLLEDLPPEWLPASVLREVERLDGLAGPERRRAASALADRLAETVVPVAAVGIAQVAGFFSPELGCKVFPPGGYGISLTEMCL